MLPDGNVMVTGGGRTQNGSDIANAVLEAEIWSPISETWRTVARMQNGRLYHSTSLLLPDGRVLVSGGGRFAGNDQLNAEIYSPPYLFKGPRPTITSAPAGVQYGTSFFVGTPSSNIASVSIIPIGSVTHSFNQNQRFLNLTFQQIEGGLTVQAPANGNLAPPGYYLLFILDSNGVPSVAPFVRFSPQPTGDSEAPLVTITSPANGATVSSFVTLSANASDNVAVAGVQFKVDDVPVGVEDTSAPYSIVWNSGTSTNGVHSVTATARDQAGNLNTAVISVTTSNTGTAPPLGLIAAYSFEEGSGNSTADSSGNGQNGTITSATWLTTGRYGNCLLFDGVSSMVTVPDSNFLDLTGALTLSAWVYPRSGSPWQNVIIKERPGGEVYNLYSNADANVPTFFVVGAAAPNSPINVSGTSVLPLNTWSHLAATYDGGILRLFINGVQVGSRITSGSLLTSNGNLRIGGNSIWGEFFDGRIDEVRIYNRALSPAEIGIDMLAPNQP
jgi:hypothetical protein